MKTTTKLKLNVIWVILALSLLVGCACSPKPQPEVKYIGSAYGINAFRSIDSLSRLKSDIITEQQSSYDRSGGNVDGFGLVLSDGKNHSGELPGTESSIKRVLLDVQSPGAIYRMWFTNFGAVPSLRIYIDGEEKASVNMSLSDMVSGKNAPFVKPFVQDKTESSGGFVSYLPISFAKSILVIGTGDFYYNIQYHVHTSGTEIEPFSMDMDTSHAAKILTELGTDPKYKADKSYISQNIDLVGQGGSQNIEVNGKKSISSIELKIPSITPVTYDRTLINDKGIRMSAGAQVSFNMKLSGAETLTARFLLLNSSQQLKVYADNIALSPTQVRARRLDGFEWKDDNYFENTDFVLPSSIASKDTINVRIVAVRDLYIYKMWSMNDGVSKDTMDFGNESSRGAHGYKTKGHVSDSIMNAEYDPNKLFSSAQEQKIFQDEEILNNIFIRITFDGKSRPSVDAPISSFFGVGEYGPYTNLMLMTGLKNDGTMYCYYPMPFDKSAKIELINNNQNNLSLEVKIGTKDHDEDMSEHGYFSTQFTRYTSNTATALKPGEYINILKAQGSGHVVGVNMSVSGDYFGEHSRYYLEGDEVVYIDGSKSHSLHGTGTEDFFNGGWYFNNGAQVNPTYGVPVHNYRNGRDRTVMIRSMVSDYVVFRSEIDFVMEHGGSNNRTDCDVAVLTYYYLNTDNTLAKTDSFLLDNQEELEAHGYISTESQQSSINISFEAKFRQLTMGRMFDNIMGESQFKLAINPDNQGLVLRRLLSAEVLGQSARVDVDGEDAGVWNMRFRSAGFDYGRYDDYILPARLTHGKQEINIRIVNNTQGLSDSVAYTTGGYEIYSIIKEK